ncbi:hypothetical protein ES703_73772 [subsurface metagenome]
MTKDDASDASLKKEKIETVLESLGNGTSFIKACKDARMDQATFWRWRQDDEKLDKQVIEVLKSRVQVAEDALYRNVIKGNVTAQIFWLKNRASNRWKDRYDGQVSGEIKLKPLRVIIRNNTKNDK